MSDRVAQGGGAAALERVPVAMKIGGSALDRLDDAWWDDLADLARSGPIVCVHGWSRQLAAYQHECGRRAEFVVDQFGHRSRLTDPQVLEDIRRVAADLRAQIARRLRERSVRVGVCTGEHERLLTAESHPLRWWRHGQLVRLTNLVGPVRDVAVSHLLERLREVDLLVVSPLAHEPRHGTVNTDGDRAAARIAAAIGAERLLLITDVSHVMDGDRPLARVRRDELDSVARCANGGMRKKLRAAGEALDGGVARVDVGSARVTSLLCGHGTTIVP